LAHLKIGGFAILIARQATAKDTFVSMHVGDYQKQSCPDRPEVHLRVPRFEKRLMARKSNQRIKSNQIKSNQSMDQVNESNQIKHFEVRLLQLTFLEYHQIPF